MKPLPCVVLAIDPGKVSGWAVGSPDGPWSYGTARTADERREAVQVASVLASFVALPLVVVAERWQGGFRKDRSNPISVAGIGAAWGRWEALLEGAVPGRRIVRVGQSTWRSRVIGGRVARKTEEWKRVAVQAVRMRYQIDVSHDEADAVLIGTWAMHAPEVARVIPKRVMRAAGMEVAG